MNEEELRNFTGFSLEEAVSIRLWDIADQCEKLNARGDTRNAELFRKEGLELSRAYERKELFIVINHQSYHQ